MMRDLLELPEGFKLRNKGNQLDRFKIMDEKEITAWNNALALGNYNK